MIQNYLPNSQGLLSPIQFILDDEQVSEILINRPREIFFERNRQMQVHQIPEFDERSLRTLFRLIANENRQILDEHHPLLSGSLLDGSRVQLVLPPTALYPTLSIRRKVVRHLSLKDYEKNGFYDRAQGFHFNVQNEAQLPEDDKELLELFKASDWSHFMTRAVELKKNIVVSGGTSSGKTTYP